ncbi:MAG TPA: tRNA (adenosine(37)-N6)-threonylcarbamoyltransferase complex ATPase subunit type 1 TsaE [Casimicrobiaceae bacterium]|jgi:tRNA threonylcarbamoyladenosine biosynthesis protein TsaE|nr:tRNA (adenosine(37)-N6)-threonylcarbamoyltransferase complex ATPase subunit type 1 TsaE [Casimicrobiaceae bacterium]
MRLAAIASAAASNAIMTSTIIEGARSSLADAATTLSAGERIAVGLSGGMVVALSGELGAGKTTLVRGMLRGLGWRGPVKSPSYALVEHYLVSSLYFYHFDFYRFSDPDEWRFTGFAEYFRPDAICVIEWPERIGPWLPEIDLAVRLDYADQGRYLTLNSHSVAGKACLDAFSARAA